MLNLSKPLKVALCDSNPVERAFLYDACKRIKEYEGIPIKLKEYHSGKALLFDMDSPHILTSVDLVLLDINMPDENGVEVAKKLRACGFQGAIIFITKLDGYWREAFDIKIFNYITKDDDIRKRFTSTFIAAAKEALDRRGRTMYFTSVSETRKVEIASISHFTAQRYLISVHYKNYENNEKFTFTSSLTKIEELLFGNDAFIRINRSNIISIAHIEKINESKKQVIMLDGTVLPVSQKKMGALKSSLANEWIIS